MTKTRCAIGALSLLAIVTVFGLVSGCERKPAKSASPTATATTEKNSFKEVTAHLDAGGDLYLYVSTEKWLDGLSQTIAGWHETVGSLPDLKGQDRENVNRIFDVATSLIKNSGVEDVSGLGLSSIAREKGFYQNRMILHHYKGKGEGYLWSLFGKSPHSLSGLDLLPTSTAFATFSDFDLPLIWSVVEKEVAEAGVAEARNGLEQAKAQFELNTGLKWDGLMKSLGGEYGVIVTLDEKRRLTLPAGQDATMELPEPGILVVVKVKDDLIFDRVDKILQSNQQVVRVDKSGLKMLTMPVPLPLPITVRPSIARSGDYLFIASTDALIEQVLAVKNGKQPGLTSTAEFKKLAQGMPQQGNQFTYVSQKFGETIQTIQQQAMEKKAESKPAEAELMKKIASLSQPSYSYTVTANTEEGWELVGNGNKGASKLVLLPAVAISGVLAGVAVPAFVKAREKAQQNGCIKNLRQIDGAKHQWALEQRKKGQDVPTWEDLKPFLSHPEKLKCTDGGTYTLNSVDEPVTCSKPGHHF